jgi:hypothetical protein
MARQDAIVLLKAEHAAVKKLFAKEGKLTKRDGQKKQDIFNHIKGALEVHATIEEEIFYLAVKKGPIGTCQRRSPRGIRRAQADKESARTNLEYHTRRRNLRHEAQGPQRRRRASRKG